MDSQSKKTIFQTLILVVFGFAAIIAIAMFATNKGLVTKKTDELVGSINVWGTLPSATITTAFESLRQQYPDLQIVYTQQPDDLFENYLVEAMANGAGPDIFMLTPEMIMRNRQRLLTIPYASFPESTFKQTFVTKNFQKLSFWSH